MGQTTTLPNYRYVSRKRRTKEDRRFITGRGKFVADVEVPGMKHVAVLPAHTPVPTSSKLIPVPQCQCQACITF